MSNDNRKSVVDRVRRRLLAAAAGIASVAMATGGAAVGSKPPTRAVDVLGAPTNLGLRPLHAGHVPGAARAPKALRAHDLVRRLGATDHGDVAAPAYRSVRDPLSGYRNGVGLAAYTRDLAQRVGELLDQGRFTLVLGGDCSVLLGSTLALKRRGRSGLLFIDGHTDFYLRPVSETSSAAGTDLALATGHGPPALVGIDALAPYMREDDTVVFGYRDYGEPQRSDVERFERAGFARHPLRQVRALGAAAAMRAALRRLERSELDGFWIHVDVDVLDPKIMPAVDSFDPGGLQFAELEDALATALASPRVRGMELTIYDPDLDPDGHLGEQLVEMLERAFTRAGLTGTRNAA
jgi:arginase